MPFGLGHHSQKDVPASSEERGRDPLIATGRGGAGNVSLALHIDPAQEPALIHDFDLDRLSDRLPDLVTAAATACLLLSPCLLT